MPCLHFPSFVDHFCTCIYESAGSIHVLGDFRTLAALNFFVRLWKLFWNGTRNRQGAYSILKHEQGHRQVRFSIRGSSCRMETVWRELSSELLEEVVTFLPLASLCRFRAVSKKWSRYISHPDFASRHARTSSPEEYVLISERDVDHQFSTGGWQVLDVASKRSFNLSDDFLAEFVKQEGIIAHCPLARLWSSHQRTILAADGGLLCLSYYINHGSTSFCELGTHEALLVCNPVLKTVKQLPYFEGWSERSEWVVMSTDRNSMEYEIFFITGAKDALQPNAVFIYQSKTASWRASAVTTAHIDALSGDKSCSTSVVLKDEFYALFFDHDGLEAGLISYNKVTGAVLGLGIDVPCGDNHDYWVSLQLVVSDGRLFCVIMNMGVVDPIMQVTSIEIVEFILARREYVHLSVLQGEMLDWFLGNNDYGQVILNSECDTPLVATGIANAIFLCSFAGRSVVYDLSNRMWHKDLDCNSFRDSRRFLDLFASNLCLSLCPP